MISKDVLKKKVDELEKQAEEIEAVGIKLLEEATFNEHSNGISINALDYRDPLRKPQRDAIIKYQQWYSTSSQLVEEYAPEWAESFKGLYSTNSYSTIHVMDYLKLKGYSSNFLTKDGLISDFISELETQTAILLSIPHIVEIQEMSLRKLISVDVARTEMEQAEILLTGGFDRAAGGIAGVALELHLKTLCDVNGVSYPPKATIDPLAQALYQAKKLDITELKHIQYLASIRNKCSHPNPVSTAEIQSLIEGVKKLI
jgi:hypothetical protein